MDFKKYFLKVDKKILIFLLVLTFSVGLLRGWNFKEWLLVRADQVRDSQNAKLALDEGIENLRLLGPKITNAALPEESGKGDTLHMGPYYYYLQFLSMKIFNNPSPWTVAVPDFIFSLLSIPIFFFLIFKFFSRKTSVLTTILFGFSFLILQYSIFSWNPNQLVFWQTLLIFSYLNFLENKEEKGRWFVVSVFSLLIISQLHFLAIIATAPVFVFLFIYQKGWKNLKLKYYFIALGLILFFHLPMIVSDIKNDGENIQRIYYSIFQQSSNENILKNFVETFDKTAEFYFYYPFSFSKDEIGYVGYFSLLYLVSSLFLLGVVFRGKSKLAEKLQSNKKKRLILIIFLYFIFFFLANIGMADRLEKPRYWLSIAPIAFLILAFWFEWLGTISRKKIFIVFLFVVFGFALFENLYSTYFFYKSLNDGVKPELPYKDPIFRSHRNLITFGGLERATDYMAQVAKKEKTNLCYLSKDYQTKSVYQYIASYKYPDLLVKNLEVDLESSKDCAMFYISEHDDGKKDLRKDFPERFDFKEIYREGPLKMWRLRVKENKDLPQRGEEIFEEEINKEEKIYLWGEVF